MPAAERWPALPFFLFACVVWLGGLGLQRLRGVKPGAVLAPWQQRFTALPPEEQRLFRALREGLLELEGLRAEAGRWPAPDELPADTPGFAEPGLRWERRTQHLTTSYVATSDGSDRRWLVLYLEPDERALKEAAPPEDEEHHTLPSGLALHVTVWTQASAAPLPAGVLAFPATEGWTQVLGR